MLDVSRHHLNDTFAVLFFFLPRNGTSSTSSLGLVDLDSFSDVPSQSTVIQYVFAIAVFLIIMSLVCQQ